MTFAKSCNISPLTPSISALACERVAMTVSPEISPVPIHTSYAQHKSVDQPMSLTAVAVVDYISIVSA